MKADEVLNKNLFFVRESTGFLNAAYRYELSDPATGEVVLCCHEQNMGVLTRLLRFSDLRRTTPFDFLIATPEGERVFRVKRGVSLCSAVVHVLDADDEPLGGFALKPFSVSGAFDVLDATGSAVCRIKGNLTGRSYSFLAPDGVQLACVWRKWTGVGKELFSGSSGYMIKIDDVVPAGGTTRRLILASVVCIGMILKVDS